MAGFVSKKSAARWNNAARIVEAAGAGTRFVPGMYREPRIVCDDLPLPGSYPAVAGAAIAAGATGNVVHDGQIYSAVNQSQCNVVIGDKLGLHVSPGCEAFFVPCVCSCSQTTPTTCCDKFIALCVNGYTQIIAVDGGSAQWTITECCECDSTAVLTISLACVTDTVTASWDYECGATTSSGTFNLSGLCEDPIVEYDDTITMSGCPVRIIATENAEVCAECSEPAPDCTCCFELDAFTVGANCDKADVPALVDDVGLTAISSATNPVCNGQTTVVTLTFTNSSGGDYGGGVDPIQVDLTSTATTKPTCTAASNSGTITNNASGFVVEWSMPGTWANGTTITRTFTMQNNGCTVGVSTASANVSAGRGYICQISWTALACP